MPKISVIVPVYNTGKYLKRCIESIISQTFEDIEIICINDGSSDNSLDILNNFALKDNRIRVISRENRGIAFTRNEGLDNSNGEYISFIDSDDFVPSDFLEKLYNQAVKNDADIAVCGITRINAKGKTLTLLKFNGEQTAINFKDKLILCDIPDNGYLWNKIYRRKNLTVRFENGRVFEDILFLPQAIFDANKIVSVPDVSYNYYRHAGTIINSPTQKSSADKDYAQAKMKEFFLDQGIDIAELKSEVKKYKFFGITFFKTVTKCGKTKHILLNFIKF